MIQWTGVVTNVMDPHASGRVQVRIIGLHDDTVNIPDEDLPWAVIMQPPTSAAHGRIGTAPVGLVAGSRVVGSWLDKDQQFPIVQGTVGRSGDPIPGQTEGGAPAINTATGSIPAATQGSTANPYSALDPNRISISAVDSRQTNINSVNLNEGVKITAAVQEGMSFARLPTTASGNPNETNVLSLLRQVDPTSSLSSLPCFTPASFQIRINIDLGSIAAGLINLIADALTRTLLDLMEQLGINSVLRAIDAAASAIGNFAAAVNALLTGGICAAPAALNSLDAGTRALARSYTNIQTAVQRGGDAPSTLRNRLGVLKEEILSRAPTEAFKPVSVVVTAPVGYVQDYHPYDNDPYPGYIRWLDSTGTRDPVFTLRNGQPNYASAAQHASYDVSSSIQSTLLNSLRGGTLDTSSLQGVLRQATGVAQVSALRNIIGSGDPVQIISGAARLLPSIYASITGLFNAGISLSVLPNTGAITQSMQRFTQAQSVLALNRARMESAFRSV